MCWRVGVVLEVVGGLHRFGCGCVVCVMCVVTRVAWLRGCAAAWLCGCVFFGCGCVFVCLSFSVKI